jgi:hypothetical protein
VRDGSSLTGGHVGFNFAEEEYEETRAQGRARLRDDNDQFVLNLRCQRPPKERTNAVTCLAFTFGLCFLCYSRCSSGHGLRPPFRIIDK